MAGGAWLQGLAVVLMLGLESVVAGWLGEAAATPLQEFSPTVTIMQQTLSQHLISESTSHTARSEPGAEVSELTDSLFCIAPVPVTGCARLVV